VLMLPDFDRADAHQLLAGESRDVAFAELLIDREEDRTLRAVLVGMLREATARTWLSELRARRSDL
jgi:hypothetical protein